MMMTKLMEVLAEQQQQQHRLDLNQKSWFLRHPRDQLLPMLLKVWKVSRWSLRVTQKKKLPPWLPPMPSFQSLIAMMAFGLLRRVIPRKKKQMKRMTQRRVGILMMMMWGVATLCVVALARWV